MLEKYRVAVESCGRCGKCIVGEAGYICPVQQHTGGFDHYVARGRNQIARAILDGKLEYTPELIDVVYTCLGCKSCYEQCGLLDHHTGQPAIDETKITRAMRVDIVREGKGPLPALKAVDSNVQKSHNPFGEPVEKRSAWAAGLDLPKTGDTVYFAGCYASYRNPKIAKATVAILKKGGIDVAYLGEDEWCCGVPELWDGNASLAEELIQHNVNALKVAGVKRVITSCAGCFHSLKTDYPEIIGKLPFEVVHSSEVIADLIENGKINLDTEIVKTLTYHDPCHLGRHENIYEPPRNALKAIKGAKFVEMPRNRGNAWCCGGGAVVAVAFPDLSKDIAYDRIQEAKGTAAEALVSACPLCENSLTQAARKDKMEVYDLSVIVAEAMGIQI
ncbi:(Fe-S)-binding protein [Calorimonas adulescens]|uniref:(Fe-S)-binding protein n=1 Tax=Calorimonas adulescens TaxID=2606906 RepID=A0A5D8QDC4_9THEO|nr:(Fe-S)-binding protein [Calorimonas adulescens]TZE82521.1 (Fe-S)-binding protein [Calorimonas adulescens]